MSSHPFVMNIGPNSVTPLLGGMILAKLVRGSSIAASRAKERPLQLGRADFSMESWPLFWNVRTLMHRAALRHLGVCRERGLLAEQLGKVLAEVLRLTSHHSLSPHHDGHTHDRRHERQNPYCFHGAKATKRVCLEQLKSGRRLARLL
jgi:hypothetical protein